MPTFGIVAEGITDQVVIENILLGFFAGEDEEPEVNFVQPLVDQTGKSGWGSWQVLFKFFEQGKHLGALQENHYLVVHVDTDRCEDKGYDVPRREGGVDLSVNERIARVVAKIAGLIGPAGFARYGHRLIFAIAVDETECWLLPLLRRDKQAAKTTGCLKAANFALEQRREELLTRGKDRKEKVVRRYEAISAAYQERATLMGEGRKNPSLAVFLANLEAMGAAIPPLHGPKQDEAAPTATVGDDKGGGGAPG